KFDNGSKSRHIAAEVASFEPEKHFSSAQLSVMDRFAQFAVVAAHSAKLDSGIEWTEEVASDAGVVMGSAYGGSESYDSGYYALFAEKASRVHPLMIPRLMNFAATSQLSMSVRAKGPSL